MTYRERREAKADRLRGWADKRVATATATIDHIDDTYRGDVAFNTQPGHIPERARVIARQERAFESLHKAESMTSRAANIDDQLAGAIYSDDPDAIEALEARLVTLEAERDRIKRYNASCRKGAPDLEQLDEKQRAEVVSLARVAGWQMKGGAFPSYVLSNLSGNIKRNRDRLELVRKQHARAAEADAAGGVSIKQGRGRACVTFAEKPERSTIDALKDAGYRWSQGSWWGEADRLPEELTA